MITFQYDNFCLMTDLGLSIKSNLRCVLVNIYKKSMKRILVAFLLTFSMFAPAFASPLYAGVQIDDITVSALFGYQFSKMYAVEAHYSKSDSQITHAGVTVDTTTSGAGITGIALFPMKLNEVLPYYLFIKVGYERITNNETYSIPTSATLTLPYSSTITSHKNQSIFGVGAEYDFTRSLVGRMGVDFLGNNRSINLCAIFKF